MRTKKTVNGWDYNYYYSDGLLVRQTWADGETIDFLYDESGLPYSFIYNGTQYYYIKNLQNDVIAIVNTSGNIVVEYEYDDWGDVYAYGSMASTVGAVNPIRYRSYYYDTDTGFYYLQTRYYDPAIRRFINADGYVNANGDILGFNMYAYCGNNPVMYVDPCGNCLHQWNFWDDCEDCGGKTFVNKMEDGYNAVSSFLDAIGLVETVNELANNSTLNKIFKYSSGISGVMFLWENTVDFANYSNETLNDPYWTTNEKLFVLGTDVLVHSAINLGESALNNIISSVAIASGTSVAGTFTSSGNIVAGALCGVTIMFGMMDVGMMATSEVAKIAHTSWDEWQKGWFRD